MDEEKKSQQGDEIKKLSKKSDTKNDTKVILNIILFILPVVISLLLRATPYFIPAADDWAYQTIYNSLMLQVYSQLQAAYPGLGMAELEDLINQETQKILNEQADEIAQVQKQTADMFRERLKNENGTTYLLAIDPYYYYRNAENIIEHGFEQDIKTEEGYIDTHVFGGLPLSERNPSKSRLSNILPWIEAYLYRFLTFLGFNVDLMAVAFFTPVILGVLAVILGFFIGKDISKSTIGGFFTALFIAIHPFLLTRTVGGFADTDIFNIIFPLILFFFFFKLLESNDLKKKIIHSALFGLFLGIYTKAWGGWWYSFDLIIGSYGVYLVYLLIVLLASKGKRSSFKDVFKKFTSQLYSFALLLLFSGIFVSLFSGFNAFINSPFAAFQGLELKEVSKGTIWPNVFTTVAELNPGNFASVVANNGGWLTLLIIFLGIALLLFRKGSLTGPKMAQFFLLVIWTIATIYTVYSGVRFNLLIVPAFSLAFGIAAAILIEKGSKLLNKTLEVPLLPAGIIIFALLLLILMLPQSSSGVQTGMLQNAIGTAKGSVPQMSDAWYQSLTKIREESEEDAIINSWWDFGHWFKAIADRPVTLDGGVQNNPQAHWLGKLMLTNDENLSIAILRMLDCGANTAYNRILNITGDDLESISIIYEILEMNEEEAYSYLSSMFNEQNASEVIKYTHCDPPENYFIASEDMVSKAGVWAHFGSWNFTKSKQFYEVRRRNKTGAMEYLQENFGLDELEAMNLVTEINAVSNADYWVAPWPTYITSSFSRCEQLNESTLRCIKDLGNNQGVILMIDLENMRAYAQTSSASYIEVEKFVFSNLEDVYVRNNPESSFNIGVVLKKEGDEYNFLLSDPALADSIFTRLFFLEGAGTNHFELFSHETDLFGNDIYVWKVNWNPEEIKENFHIINDNISITEIENEE